jgi:hypothetical protein
MDKDLLKDLNQDKRVYKLFISHGEGGNREYTRFVDKLETYHDFEWENKSVTGKSFKDETTKIIETVDVVIILSGLYSKNKDLIEEYIQTAKELGKPLVVIRPWGMENVPGNIEDVTDEVVGWNAPCIVDAIRNSIPDDEYEGEGSCSID